MKYLIPKTSFLICLTFYFVTNLAHAQSCADWYYITPSSINIECSQKVMSDNEHQRNKIGQEAMINCNPLLLNGHVLDYEGVDIRSRGVLTVVQGQPESVEAQAIPFKVFLRRKGKLLEREGIGFAQASKYEIEISQVLAYSQPGDLLIIDPIKKEDWKAKRILKISGGC